MENITINFEVPQSLSLLTRTAEEEHRELKSRWQQMSNNSTRNWW